ncbi:hypothetical protein AB0M80_43105 [Amycolatopsis sp. NPDC051045]|uniref:hypothetical protein n=1 Tax=Amycolatopsis sp. NPDC051045 TaxID=3156922 RepID=UPI00343520E6
MTKNATAPIPNFAVFRRHGNADHHGGAQRSPRPCPLADGLGLYEIRAVCISCTAVIPVVNDDPAGAEHYVVTVHRSGDWHDEDHD